MASGLSDFYRLEREELQRRGKDSRINVAAAGAPVPSAKALGQLHADVLRRQSQLHDEWEERVALGLERGARGGAASRDEARATTAQVRHRVRHSGHPTLLRPHGGTAASRGSTAAGPRASTSGPSAGQAGASDSWGFGIGPDGSAGLEWARGGGGRIGALRSAPEVSPLKPPGRPLSRALTAATGARASSGAPAPGLSPRRNQSRGGAGAQRAGTVGAGAGGGTGSTPFAATSWGAAALGPPPTDGDAEPGRPATTALARGASHGSAGMPSAEYHPMRSGTPPDYPLPFIPHGSPPPTPPANNNVLNHRSSGNLASSVSHTLTP